MGIKFQKIYPVISLFLICVVVTIALAAVNYLTKDKISSQMYESIYESCLTVMPDAETFKEDKDIYIAKDSNGSIIGYIFKTEAKGYANSITVMTGITKEGHISGIEILSSSETPGLGLNSSEQWFRDRFITDYAPGRFDVIKESAEGKQSKIEAITGATISSNAVCEAVNNAIELFKNLR